MLEALVGGKKAPAPASLVEAYPDELVRYARPVKPA
jgi:hypothetical protein